MRHLDTREELVAFRLTPAEHIDLKLLARFEHRTKSELLRELIREKKAALASGGQESRAKKKAPPEPAK